MILPSSKISKFIQELPKVELHLHLEGCVTPELWLKLIQKYQPDAQTTIQALEARFVYASFFDFMDTYRDIIFSFQEPEDIYDLTKFVMNQLVQQNVRYCEVMFTPFFFVKRGIPYKEMMDAVDKAAKEVELNHPIVMKLIFDGPRNFGTEVVSEVFDMAINDTTGRVIGVGLGGDELNYPATLFQKEFEKAQSCGLKLIAHAGETDGEQSMIDTIEKLKVNRIGHGIGITKNSKLDALIRERDITIDLCPGSNLATGVLKSLEDHPFWEYYQSGYKVSLNSDDPGLFKTSLNLEYFKMAELHNLSEKDLIQIVLNGISGTFLSEVEKNMLAAEVKSYLK
jgi:aminodeoxyfutalosine deaminase